MIVYELESGKAVVAAMSPLPALGVAGGGSDLEAVAREADAGLRRALASLEAT